MYHYFRSERVCKALLEVFSLRHLRQYSDSLQLSNTMSGKYDA
jgi:hypothetical protein